MVYKYALSSAEIAYLRRIPFKPLAINSHTRIPDRYRVNIIISIISS